MTAPPANTTQQYWLRYVGLLIVAGAIAFILSSIGERRHWLQSQEIAAAVSVGFFFSLTPDRPGRPPRSWSSRVVSGVLAAAVIFL